MRLTKQETDSIRKTFYEIFEQGNIYLFGSRLDDTKKGGDIDLYISTPDKENLSYKKIQFLAALKREIGDQKIDIVLDYGEERLIDRVAKSEGVKL